MIHHLRPPEREPAEDDENLWPVETIRQVNGSEAKDITLVIRNHAVEALADSGAFRSLLHEKVLNRLGIGHHELERAGVHLRSANNGIIKTLGAVTLDLVMNDHARFRQRFIIVAAITEDCILGRDALFSHGIIIDGFRQCVYQCLEYQQALTRRELGIGPGQSKTISLVTHSPFWDSRERTVLVEPIVAHEDIYIQEAVTTTSKEGLITVHVTNTGERAVRFTRKTSLVRICQVEVQEPLPIARINQVTTDESGSVDQRTLDALCDDADRTEPEQDALKKLVIANHDLFAKTKMDLGRATLVKHKIETESKTPIRLRPYRIPYALTEIAQTEVDDMLRQEIIEPSDSPWAAPVLLVKKKNGEYRFCIDYRKLNEVTKKDAYPIPHMNELLDKLHGNQYFSTLDLASGYWQIEIEESDREKTAFIFNRELYQFKRMPFGLCNAPATFQRFMNHVLRGLDDRVCLVYLDDVIILGRSLGEHLKHIDTVFRRLRHAGVKLRLKKCHFLKACVEFLGHLVTREGTLPCPGNIEKVVNFPIPRTKKEVKGFLGLASYYRRFICGFSSIAHPLIDLTKETVDFCWKPEHFDAFKRLRTLLTTAPILVYPDFEHEFILFTDASDYGIGGVLSQRIEKLEKPIAYYNRHLSETEQRYSTTEKECLAIVDSVKHFRQYLNGRHFTLVVDHQPLEYLKSAKDTNRRLNRWSLELAAYDYTVTYRKGKSHGNADALSRIPINAATEKQPRMVELQRSDPLCRGIMEFIEDQVLPDDDLTPSWLEDVSRYYISSDGILKRAFAPINSRRRDFLRDHTVAPAALRREIVTAYHDTPLGGHLGFRKTYEKIRDRFFWPRMAADVKEYCASCHQCALTKRPIRIERSPMQPMPVQEQPFDKVAIDILGPLRHTPRDMKYVLVMTDYLTRWVEAVALPNITAQTVADAFVDQIICRHGAPRVLLTDRGTNFVSHLFTNVCKILGIGRQLTSPYHPQTDGLVERFNKTFAQMMTNYVNETHTDWDLIMPKVIFAHNTAVQASTLETPFYLLYFRDPRYPIEADLEGTPAPYASQGEYQEEMLRRMKKAHALARENTLDAQKRQKEQYDKKATERRFDVGDLVYMTEPVVPKGLSKKFRVRWKGPYRVIDQLGNCLYEILSPGEQKSRRIHANRLKLLHEKTPWDEGVRATDEPELPTPRVDPDDWDHETLGPSAPEGQESPSPLEPDEIEGQEAQRDTELASAPRAPEPKPGRLDTIPEESEHPIPNEPEYPLPQTEPSTLRRAITRPGLRDRIKPRERLDL